MPEILVLLLERGLLSVRIRQSQKQIRKTYTLCLEPRTPPRPWSPANWQRRWRQEHLFSLHPQSVDLVSHAHGIAEGPDSD